MRFAWAALAIWLSALDSTVYAASLRLGWSAETAMGYDSNFFLVPPTQPGSVTFPWRSAIATSVVWSPSLRWQGSLFTRISAERYLTTPQLARSFTLDGGASLGYRHNLQTALRFDATLARTLGRGDAQFLSGRQTAFRASLVRAFMRPALIVGAGAQYEQLRYEQQFVGALRRDDTFAGPNAFVRWSLYGEWQASAAWMFNRSNFDIVRYTGPQAALGWATHLWADARLEITSDWRWKKFESTRSDHRLRFVAVLEQNLGAWTMLALQVAQTENRSSSPDTNYRWTTIDVRLNFSPAWDCF